MSKEIDAADIEEYVSTQSDFDLELFVYKSVEEHGMTASHGGSYFDPITGKSRQFDVRAYMYVPDHRGIFLAIECKSLSKEFPLIVSRVPRPEENAYHELLQTWGRKDGAEDFQIAVQCAANMPKLYPVSLPVGKKMMQIRRELPNLRKPDEKTPFTASDADTFDKWSQALSSANDFIEEARKKRGVNGSGHFFSAVLPVLVVSDDTLWAVDYSDTGRSRPEQIDETTLFVGRPYTIRDRSAPFTITHLHVYTRRGFTAFLRNLQQASANGLREKTFAFSYRL